MVVFFLKPEKLDLLQKIAENTIPNPIEKGRGRPFCLAIQDIKTPEIFWAVPISSKVEKYKSLASKAPDKVVIGKMLGKNNAFLLQNTIPITKEYIGNVYMRNGQEVIVNFSTLEKIQTKLKELLQNPDKFQRKSFTKPMELKKYIEKELQLKQNKSLTLSKPPIVLESSISNLIKDTEKTR